MTEQSEQGSWQGTEDAPASTASDVLLFVGLAVFILPIAMFGVIAAYGFVVWFLQILVFGPPT